MVVTSTLALYVHQESVYESLQMLLWHSCTEIIGNNNVKSLGFAGPNRVKKVLVNVIINVTCKS